MTAAANQRITALASDRAIHRAFAWLHLHEPTIRRWQLEAIAIPAPPFNEAPRAQYFLQQFTTLALQNSHIDAAGNALAELQTSPHSNGPVILLSAHLDTVFPRGTDCTPREDGPRIQAPGATDNAAGLAALLALAAALKHAGITPKTTILFAANVGEEGEGDLRGMKHLFSPESSYHQRIQAAIALEGSGNVTVVDRALGSRRLRVTITGPGGHSWADAGLPNPILALSHTLIAPSAVPLPKSPRTTLNIGTICGGTSVNSIPETATADLDIRSTDALQLDRTELAVLKILEFAVNIPLHLQVQRIGNRSTGALDPQSQLAQSLRAIDRHLSLATEAHIGSTDANLPLSLGIPALAIGAGGTGGGMHTLQEWYDPTNREIALRRTLLLLLDSCDPATCV